ncbi:MAG: GyrI-like domain-containing protein [Bacteroidetes bacterium]|nr:GyrI-like domain-containing protein [Bacteroidota bacterium]
MTPQIITSSEKKLIGKRSTMSLANYRIGELWRSFMPQVPDIPHRVSADLVSMAVYPPRHFSSFNPQNEFERWAAVEVSEYGTVPADLETFLLPGGWYAVFHYKGASNDPAIFHYIYNTWLPGSAYTLDHRPHVEWLGPKYKNNDPDSEEEIWIPIQPLKPLP